MNPVTLTRKHNVVLSIMIDKVWRIFIIPRKQKDWMLANAIRDKLKGLGIALEDMADGLKWKLE